MSGNVSNSVTYYS